MFPLNRRQRIVLRLIIVNLALLLTVPIWLSASQDRTVAVAVAKGKQMLDQNMVSAPALDAAQAREMALEGLQTIEQVDTADLEFVSAVHLSTGEARSWQEEGCTKSNCAQVTFYDHANHGSREVVVDLETAELVESWANPNARPGGSTWILPRAMAIAARDDEVASILGEIGDADPAMVPMSGWLADSVCSKDWCVDLTFHDPAGSGRIMHVFVNMERDEVERIFYTRGRPERSAAKPLAQRNEFTDGCHEQYGWEVCWEMTANDGVEFRDAKYGGTTILRSAKIGQVEAWYPSWPGGYRDEIGFSASVPPFGDTQVNDLGNGFEVRQMFTEFTRWPNCICCYRYEEAINFYADGSMAFRFLSHGPGCDDLSIYRPFWRIDIDLDDPENDEVWLWDNLSWQEQPIEFEEHPIVGSTTQSGQKMATIDGDLHYRWTMKEFDPFGRDEGYFFLLQFKEGEGDGPITAGPGDTFIPPRQWIDGDSLSGENIVLWHVPLLKTNKGDPWWCMPDPDPEFSPCEAVLLAEPGEEFAELSPEELATAQAIPTAAPAAEPAATLVPTPTPRPIEGGTPEEIMLNAGCTSCHQIGSLGESHKVGPDLSTIGLVAESRVEGMPADEYIRQSIVDPNAYLAPECPNGPCLANIMPRDYQQRLSQQQVDILVRHLLDQRSPAAERSTDAYSEAENISKAFPAPKRVQPDPQDTTSFATQAVAILVLSLVFLISLLVYFRGSPEEE